MDSKTWKIVEAMARKDGFLLHQTMSFDKFVASNIEEVIQGFNPIQILNKFNASTGTYDTAIDVVMSCPELKKPTIHEKDGSTSAMWPQDARMRNLTYSSNLYVRLGIVLNGVVQKEFTNVLIGKIPIMVGSSYCVTKTSKLPSDKIRAECMYDRGGYFIVNGAEKVIISQDRVQENKTFVFPSVKSTLYTMVAEVRSVQDNLFSPPKLTTLKMSAHPNEYGPYIRVAIHHVRTDIPLFILFRALGIASDKRVCEIIGGDLSELRGSIMDGNSLFTQKEAIEYVSHYINSNSIPREQQNLRDIRMSFTRGIIERDVLPHCGPSLERKAVYLGYMVRRLLKHTVDDRDSYINKRVDTPGILMANIFRQYFGKMVKDVKKSIAKEINSAGTFNNVVGNVINRHNIARIIKSSIIESGLKYALATGVWGLKSNKNTRQGVAQVLNRMTFCATLSHMRRVNTPIEKNGKLVQPRRLHTTQWGVICPAECFDPETPILTWEGEVKKAKDIKIGDLLIDDGGNSVRVKSTCSGFRDMYEVVPDKANFMRHTVTDNHILTLKVRTFKYTDFDNEEDLRAFKSSVGDDNVIDITIERYLSLPQGVKQSLVVFKSDGINWDHRDVALDPYILGMWLGDGDSCGYGFATADKELLDKWIEWGADHDGTIKHGAQKYLYGISSTTQPGISCNKTEQAPLKKLLSKYDLVKKKRIPLEYIVNDRETRLALLAGLIDADGNVSANGHEIRIRQEEKNYRIIYDTEHLARSLGFSCHVNDGVSLDGKKRHKELTITGPKLYEIPTVLPRKKLNKYDNPVSEKRSSSCLQSPFELVKKDFRPFVGWQVEGNGRFLLGDMTVTHNTPEGASVGIVKNLAMTARVTLNADSLGVRALIGVCSGGGSTRVVVNGDIVGTHPDPDALFELLKTAKRCGQINPFVSVAWNRKENSIIVCTEAGRSCRPMYVVYPGNVLKDFDPDTTDWDDLILGGVIEYVDVQEMACAMVAMTHADLTRSTTTKFTHMEMHPSFILGVLASMIPFSEHNQSPRNSYQSAMGKQAIGVYCTNFRHRFDTIGHILNYPQKPIVYTRMARLLGCDTVPNGVNVIVAIATFTGFNQEDGIIVNKSAIERGLFNSSFFRTYKEQNTKNFATGEKEFFCNAEEKCGQLHTQNNYSKLTPAGFVPENVFVEDNDVIISKVMPSKNGGVVEFKDTSATIKDSEAGFIDCNVFNNSPFTTVNGDGHEFAKVRIRQFRVPTVGDKLASRFAQKGSIGMTLNEEDMPFTADGMRPDLILNPMAIPSRMTIGQLMEVIMGKACVMNCNFGDGTTFNGVTVEQLADELEKTGMDKYADETMYDGRTGKRMTTKIFIGPVYYQRLKHMVADKCHSRSTGAYSGLIRQPAEGRSRGGGLRLGEMERDVIACSGMMSFLKERFVENSDNFKVYICRKCKQMAIVNPEMNIFKCKNCNHSSSFCEVRMPYSCKLFLSEISAMAVETKFICS